MMASDLEDDVILQPIENEQQHVNNEQPRKLSRLRKVSAAEKVLAVDLDDEEPETEQVAEQELSAAQDDNQDDALEIEGDAPAAEEEDYWDEEDDLENYLRTRFENGEEASDEEAEAPEGKNKDKKKRAVDDAEDDVARDPNDLNAETQRILREAASRDRLGKGHKIDIKPLHSIVEKLLQRRAVAIARAPKVTTATALAFDDIMEAAAAENVPLATGAEGDAAGSIDVDPSDDLVIASEEGGADLPVVELPGSAMKKSTRPSFAYANDESLPFDDGYEDEMLVEDGAESGDDSDGESDRSWEARGSDEEEEVENEERSDGEVCGDGPTSHQSLNDDEEEDQEASNEENAQVEIQDGAPFQDETAALEPVAAAVDGKEAAAAAKRTKLQDRLRRVFLDTEAELSDEEGMVAVSDDEEEGEDVDHNGEVADLIGQTKETVVDVAMRERLHRQWAEQKDAKDLQEVLRGLKQGFRKRRLGGGLDDDDDEMDGRRRRLRLDGEEEFEMPAGGWLGAGLMDHGAGQDEEEEDLEVLLKAQQQRLLAGSQDHMAYGGSAPGLTLDEDSQHVLDLLVRSASEPQPDSCVVPGRSRLAAQLASFGSQEGAGSNNKRVPSFLGRQSSVQRGVSNSGFGNGGKSFIFGKDNSMSAAPNDAMGEAKQKEEVQGPVDFANLSQLVGMPSAAGGAKRPAGGSSLVSRLSGKNKSGSSGDSQSKDFAAANAVCQQLALGGHRR